MPPAEPTAPAPLAEGHRGTGVTELRRRLGHAGYATVGDDPDHFGPATARAVAAFQSARGLDASGACDESTWAALAESEHQLGDRLLCLRTPMMRGDDVAELQLRLGTLGFDSGRVDGIFGPLTQHAVGDFQRNAGIVFDQVCGPDTCEALRRLEGRTGSSSVTSVRERVKLQRRPSGLGTLRIALGAATMADPVIGGLAAALSPKCGALVLLEGEPSVQAKAANDFEAHVYLGVEHSGTTTVEVDYFSAPGFESVGGRALAELIIRELPAGPQWGLGVARGMRIPILRETRAPAVQVKLAGARAAAHRDLLVNALERALERWATEPLGDR